ncbi:uncharacterized protein F5147DRAFT_839268 [Suillus discolor]|uniref:Uncharacterized protein n=1 Tax=Suillus discolor TaxID=1912936 RepID=A0A9P7F1I6_9AGAM|nr:uncharacterized protein F5147DRAFT_839268 [Suillus discolor]KAG2100172.1 hypothetical protein F5147DRAFT_839268 [Suillus discolor]
MGTTLCPVQMTRDMKTGEAVGAPFQGHTGSVLSVAISPDDKHIVSGSEDKTIRVWDIEFLNKSHLSKAPAICFSSNPSCARLSASFLQDSSAPVSVVANEDGWVVGPDGQLLLWIPHNFHPVISPGSPSSPDGPDKRRELDLNGPSKPELLSKHTVLDSNGPSKPELPNRRTVLDSNGPSTPNFPDTLRGS